MKANDLAYEEILVQLSQNPVVYKEDIVNIVRKYYEPDIEKLIEKEINRKADYLVSRIRDKDRVRTCFAVRGKKAKKTRYVYLPRIKERTILDELANGFRALRDRYASYLMMIRQRQSAIDSIGQKTGTEAKNQKQQKMIL